MTLHRRVALPQLSFPLATRCRDCASLGKRGLIANVVSICSG